MNDLFKFWLLFGHTLLAEEIKHCTVDFYAVKWTEMRFFEFGK